MHALRTEKLSKRHGNRLTPLWKESISTEYSTGKTSDFQALQKATEKAKLQLTNAYFIGEILKEYRTRFEISQEELSFGLCAVLTLSRIEKGTQIPGRKLAEALFSKMKTPSSTDPMSRLDFKRENPEHKIIGSIANGIFDIFATLEEYKSCKKTLAPLEKSSSAFSTGRLRRTLLTTTRKKR